MKKIIPLITALCALAAAQGAEAYLGNSALTSYKLAMYAVYTTSDPTCMTKLVATLPFRATPSDVDLVQNPTLGMGPLSNPVRCVILVLKNSVGPMVWKAGTYTGTSSFYDGSQTTSASDNI